MPYYSSEKDIIDTQKFDYFDQGGCATIYRNGETLLKIYNKTCKRRHRINRSMFEKIKNSNIPNVVKLLDCYSSSEVSNPFKPVEAYTMELVKGKKIDLLEQKRDYLINVIDQLEETIDKLVELKLVPEDPTSHNIIFTENGATILDADQFLRFPILTRRFLYDLNKEKMIIFLNKTIDDTRKDEAVKHIFCGFNSSLSKDFSDFLEEETINETIQKKVLKSI